MNIKKIEIYDLLVLIALCVFTTWYLLDAYSASEKIENLIFILPIAVAIFTMCSLEITNQFLGNASKSNKVEKSDNACSVLGVMALFAVYVLTLEWIGFDLGTALFIGGFLYSQGERRFVWIFAYSVVFSSVIALFFANMLPYPMPMTFLTTDY